GAGADAGEAGAAAAFAGRSGAAPSAIVPSSASGATVSPVLTVTSESTPEARALTSSVTLSVSSSTIGSSRATCSPAFLNHFPTVASLTDSPSGGTRISTVMRIPLDPRCVQIEAMRPANRYERSAVNSNILEQDLREKPRAGFSRPRKGQAANASSRSVLSCARCFGSKPVAVAADAG